MPRGENLKGVGGPGRPKGLQNKLTVEIKTMIESALIEVGGQQYLENLARTKPEIFASLLSKIIPRSLNLSSANRRIVDFKFIVSGKRGLESGDSQAAVNRQTLPPGDPPRQLE